MEARVQNVQQQWPEVDKLMAAVAAAAAAAGSQGMDQGWRAAADQASQAVQMLQEGYCSSRQVPCAVPLSQQPHCTPSEWTAPFVSAYLKIHFGNNRIGLA